MKITNLKSMMVKGATVGLLAGAFVLATPAKADAQVVVQFGHPHYAYGYAPGYYAPGYYARGHYDRWHHPVPVYHYGYRRHW